MNTPPLEIERKYVILIPDLEHLCAVDGYTVSKITQTYLISPSHITHRVRRREYPDRVVYTETKKIRIDKISVYEDERELTESEYLALIKSADPALTPIIKVRHTVPVCDVVAEIDIYPNWKHTCIMETELPSREHAVTFPPYIRIVKEVTGEKQYSNASMSRSFPPEIDP